MTRTSTARDRTDLLHRLRSAVLLGCSVLAIVGASVIGLNDWADGQATSAASSPAASSQPVTTPGA